jgi:hypothetical protein
LGFGSNKKFGDGSGDGFPGMGVSKITFLTYSGSKKAENPRINVKFY